MADATFWDKLAGAKWIVIWGLLGAYGAVEAFFRLLRGIPRIFAWVGYHWRNRNLAKNFYYKYREGAYRISPDGRSYLYVRKEIVVALERLTEIPISFRWTGEGSADVTIQPDSFTLADAARVRGQNRTRKLIRPNTELKKHDTADYTFTVKCAVTGNQPENFLGSQSSHRVDELVLRVIFALARMPAHVWHVVQDQDGREISRQAIDRYDPITGEYRRHIKRPDAHLIYVLEWEWDN
jgi:hypothetical protein